MDIGDARIDAEPAVELAYPTIRIV